MFSRVLFQTWGGFFLWFFTKCFFFVARGGQRLWDGEWEVTLERKFYWNTHQSAGGKRIHLWSPLTTRTERNFFLGFSRVKIFFSGFLFFASSWVSSSSSTFPPFGLLFILYLSFSNSSSCTCRAFEHPSLSSADSSSQTHGVL